VSRSLGFMGALSFMVSLSNHEATHRGPCGPSWFDRLTMKEVYDGQ